MSSLTLKNVKKIYPFSGDDVKRNKKKEKIRKRLEKKNPEALAEMLEEENNRLIHGAAVWRPVVMLTGLIIRRQ